MKKRIFTLFVTFCLVLSMVVPAAFAADDSGALTYSFYDNTVTSGTTKYQGVNANKGEVSFTSDPAASHLNTSYSSGGVQLASSYFLANFSKDRTVQDWCALKISDVVAGTYDMTFDLQNSNKAGVFTVFVVTENAYSTILNNEEKDYMSTLSAGGDLTQAQNKEILTALESVALNQVSEGKLDNGNQNDTPELQSIGKVTFPENGSYVIVFRCDGKSGNCKDAGTRLVLNSLIMTPQMASLTADGKTTYCQTAAEAIAAIAAADENTVVKITGKLQLSDDLNTAAAITVSKGAELDLNGKTLTATVDATQGTVTDTTDGKGAIVGTSAVVAVGDSEVALKQGNICRIFDYELTVDATPVEKTVEEKTQVSFWFHVKMDEAAYAMLGDSKNPATGLTVGANMQWTPAGGATVNKLVAELDDSEVTKWAGLMSSGDWWFYVNVTGFESLTDTGSLVVVPTINAVASDAITYSVN